MNFGSIPGLSEANAEKHLWSRKRSITGMIPNLSGYERRAVLGSVASLRLYSCILLERGLEPTGAGVGERKSMVVSMLVSYLGFMVMNK